MDMAPSKPARSAYHWTESKIQEVNKRLSNHGLKEVEFHLPKSRNPTEGIIINRRPNDRDEWHLIHRIVDEVLSARPEST